MKAKLIIATVVVIALIATASFIFLYYQGQNDSQAETLHSLVDDTGYKTSIDSIPNKIVSLAPSTTEILYALGLDKKVVGVSEYDNYPYNFTAWIAAGNMTSIGAFDNPNMEAIASLEPDLILTTAGVQAPTIDTLRNLGYKVLVLNPANISGVFQNIELVGNATGKTTEAAALVSSIQSRIEAVVNKVQNAQSRPKVYYEVWYDPTSLWTAGAKAWQNELIEKAGGINIFSDQNVDYFQSSAEAVIERSPNIILLPAQGMGYGEPFWGNLDTVKSRPGWNSIDAVQNNRLCQVDSDTISRAGPRVADAIEELAKLFHPELF